jgi:hypothetical protein
MTAVAFIRGREERRSCQARRGASANFHSMPIHDGCAPTEGLRYGVFFLHLGSTGNGNLNVGGHVGHRQALLAHLAGVVRILARDAGGDDGQRLGPDVFGELEISKFGFSHSPGMP